MIEQQHTRTNGATFNVSYRQRRRRRPDLGEWIFGVMLGGAFALSLLLGLALGLTLLWLIVVIVQDLGRRLGG
ncbi:MAG TPA: hypothetical protein VGJ60_16645 [Chloroflexota bacterium]